MCGRYTITVTLEELIARFELDIGQAAFYQPRYNIAPSQTVPAIVHDGSNNRIGLLKWGLIPAWSKDSNPGSTFINARSETAAVKPAFREPLRRKRCIIPADGFYEWTQRLYGQKQPMRIIMKDHSLFSMAALYDTWLAPNNIKINTFAILTTTANETVAPIHERMPVILDQEGERIWLNRSIENPLQLKQLLRPYPAELMTAYPVSQKTGNASYESASLIEPCKIEGQLELW